MSNRNSSGVRPVLCYVTDRRTLASSGTTSATADALLNIVQAAAAAGVDWIQIREKDLSGRECSALVREALGRVAKSCHGSGGTRIVINDRLDVALAERSGGVHLRADSFAVGEARRLLAARSGLTQGFLLGVSCHSLREAQEAANSGADYIFFGPVYATPSKARYGHAQGPEKLAEVCGAVGIPVLAVGGINLENASECLAAGAAGIAAIRLFQESQDIDQVVLTMRSS